MNNETQYCECKYPLRGKVGIKEGDVPIKWDELEFCQQCTRHIMPKNKETISDESARNLIKYATSNPPLPDEITARQEAGEVPFDAPPLPDWSKEFERFWVGLRAMQGLHPNYTGKDLIKSFISTLVQQAYEKGKIVGVAEHDAKWHPLEKDVDGWKMKTHKEVIDQARKEGEKIGQAKMNNSGRLLFQQGRKEGVGEAIEAISDEAQITSPGGDFIYSKNANVKLKQSLREKFKI